MIRDAFGSHSEICLKSCGAFSVRLFPKGQERFLLLDDFVLCCCSKDKDDDDESHHLYSSPSLHSRLQGDLWIRLLEKVFLKIQGSLVASLDGHYKYKSLYRHPARALQLLTGARVAAEMHYSGQDMETVYNVLVTTQGRFARVVHCRKTMSGLHSNHGYSLLWIGEAAGEQLVCLRNPHGRGSYTGKYGRSSKVWQTNHRLVSDLLLLDCFVLCKTSGRVTWVSCESRSSRNLSDVPADDDDGVFLMEFSVFVECFPVMTLVGPMNASESHSRNRASLDVPDCVYRIRGAHFDQFQTLLKQI